MLLCAITDRRLLGVDENSRRDDLVARAREWAAGGVDFIQVREKDLEPAALLSLARRVATAVGEASSGGVARTSVLLNGPAEIAFEAGCDGVHLAGGWDGETIAAAREAFAKAGRQAVVSVACHSVDEARLGAAAGASLVVFAPVFEKRLPGQEAVGGGGLAALAAVCRAAGDVPVLALGGVTVEKAGDCVQAGSAGVAAIRMFVGEDWRGLD